jgi:hypothetical protein
VAAKRDNEHETLALIVEEVDDARDVYELHRQLAPHLPIKQFDDLRKVASESGSITFRGQEFDVSSFEALVPSVVFPIEDASKLVQLLVEVVRHAPPHVGRNLEDAEQAKRLTRRLGMRIGSAGLIGPAPHPSSLIERSRSRPVMQLGENSEG